LNHLIRWSLITFCLNISVVYADAPFIDYQWVESPDACLERAKIAMLDSGFKTVASTGIAEVVGQKGEYKGVVACIGEASDMAILIVSGKSYPQARKLAVKLKKQFLK